MPHSKVENSIKNLKFYNYNAVILFLGHKHVPLWFLGDLGNRDILMSPVAHCYSWHWQYNKKRNELNAWLDLILVPIRKKADSSDIKHILILLLAAANL